MLQSGQKMRTGLFVASNFFKEGEISNGNHINTFHHTLNMLLHNFVNLLMRSNMLQIWKKMKAKRNTFYLA